MQKNGVWESISSALGGHPRRLLNLAEIEATGIGRDYYDAGVRMVSIRQIRGSANEGRLRDFDADFRPLKAYDETRWQSVATARQQGIKFPPVFLIQVGNVYFVQDGHHRISVARTMGYEAIEARVIVWQVTRPSLWSGSPTNHSS